MTAIGLWPLVRRFERPNSWFLAMSLMKTGQPLDLWPCIVWIGPQLYRCQSQFSIIKEIWIIFSFSLNSKRIGDARWKLNHMKWKSIWTLIIGQTVIMISHIDWKKFTYTYGVFYCEQWHLQKYLLSMFKFMSINSFFWSVSTLLDLRYIKFLFNGWRGLFFLL